jgi:hypothetical protein
MLGAFAGNRLGAVRDAKGKSVAAVFSGLGGNQKAEVSRYHECRFALPYPHPDITCIGHEGFRLCDVVALDLPWTLTNLIFPFNPLLY